MYGNPTYQGVARRAPAAPSMKPNRTRREWAVRRESRSTARGLELRCQVIA